MKTFIIVLIAVAIIGGGGYMLLHNSSNKTTTATNSTNNSQSQSASSTSSQSTTNTITFDGNQFSPATLTVKSDTVVTIKNTSSQDLQMNSNPHPVHTDDTDLNVGAVAAGQSQIFTVTKTGSFGYHDHLDPGIHGKITIE